MKFLVIVPSVLAIFSSNVKAQELSSSQKTVRIVAKAVGDTVCVKDFCFGETLEAIAMQESSLGKFIVGDSKKVKYFYNHRGNSVYVKKSDTFIEDGIRYAWYQYKGKKFIKRVYSKHVWKSLNESSIGPFQIKVETAQETIRKAELKQYYSLLSNDDILVSKLLSDIRFSAIISANYLKLNYERALGKGWKNPWWFAVSKYNGGSYNTRYVKRIKFRMKQLNALGR